MIAPGSVEANGLTFATLEAGEGPLVLLFHGFPDTAHTWDRTLEVLAGAGFRGVAPFMRGYYPTQAPAEEDYGVETLGRDVIELLGALADGPAVVVGHDWGAYAVYAAAMHAPRLIQRLVTVAIPHPSTFTPRFATPSRLWRTRHFLAYKSKGAANRLRRDGFAGLERIVRRWSPTWEPDRSELAAAREAFSHPGCLEAVLGYYRALPFGLPAKWRRPIAVPTLTVYGDDDGAADAKIFAQAEPFFSASYRTIGIPRAGHFVHREQPGAFHSALLKFLRQEA